MLLWVDVVPVQTVTGPQTHGGDHRLRVAVVPVQMATAI